MGKALRIYSGRNRPDLTPVYLLFERLTGVRTTVEKVYHHDAEKRVLAERADPQADLLLTNSQLALELVRETGVFEPYAAPVAKAYPDWLRAPDHSWLSFTAWPRAAMVNRTVLADSSAWPARLEDLTDARFRGAVPDRQPHSLRRGPDLRRSRRVSQKTVSSVSRTLRTRPGLKAGPYEAAPYRRV